MKSASKDHALPMFDANTKWDEWLSKFLTHLGIHGLKKYFTASNKPSTDEPEWLPAVADGDVAAFKRHVRDVAENRALIPGLLHNTADVNIDTNMFQLYAKHVRRNRAALVKWEKDVEEWPDKVAQVYNYLEAAAEKYQDSKDIVKHDGAGDLDAAVAALMKRFDKKQGRDKSQILREGGTMRYKSGENIGSHNLKVRTLQSRMKEVFQGEVIKIDDLIRMWYVDSLAPFITFESVVEHILTMKEDTSLEEILSHVEKAKEGQGKISFTAQEEQVALAKLLELMGIKSALRASGSREQQSAQDKAAFAAKKADRDLHRAQSQAGGANGEGFVYQAQTQVRGLRPESGLCFRCFKAGHHARDCNNDAHPDSRFFQRAQPLYKGPRSKNEVHFAPGQEPGGAPGASPSAGSLTIEEKAAYADRHIFQAIAEQEYMQVDVSSSSSVGNSVSGSNCSPFVGDCFALDEGEAVTTAKARKPLAAKQVRELPDGTDIDICVDSACYENLGPEEDVRQACLNCVSVDNEQILTADAEGPALDVALKGELPCKVRTERGRYKETELPFRGVTNLRKYLLSVPWCARNRHVVHFANDLDGGSWIQFNESNERIPIQFIDQKYFRLNIKLFKERKFSLRQKQEVNLETVIKYAHRSDRILAETKKRKLVRNFPFFPDVPTFKTETSLTQDGQKAPFPGEVSWRPATVGALTRMDLKKIPVDLAKFSVTKYVLICVDARSRHCRRYMLRNTAQLHEWVRLYRNWVRRKGFKMGHLMPDGQFRTAGLAELAAEEPSFDFAFSAPHCQSQNGLAEANIKGWERGVKKILDWAMRDPKSKVTYEMFPLASDCLTEIENQLYTPEAPEMSPFEAVNGVQPDASIMQQPLCRVWFYIYPDLRKNVPFADRRAEGIWAGCDLETAGYRIFNIASGRIIFRRVADCVFKEPGQVFDYADTVLAAEKAWLRGEFEVTAVERRSMTEMPDQSDTHIEIRRGNKPQDYVGPDGKSYAPIIGNLPPSEGQASLFEQPELPHEESSSSSDSGSGSDSDSESDSGSVGNKLPEGEYEDISSDEEELSGLRKSKRKKSKVSYPAMLTMAQKRSRANHRKKQRRQRRPSSQNLKSSISVPKSDCGGSGAHLGEAFLAETVHRQDCLFSEMSETLDWHAVPSPVKTSDLPNIVVAQTGEPIKQTVAVDLTDTARQHHRSELESIKSDPFSLLSNSWVFTADFVSRLASCPSSWNKAAKGDDAKQWLKADAVEGQRMKDFEAYTRVPIWQLKQQGYKLEHLVRVLRVKPDPTADEGIERKVRWAYDEARASDSQDFETYASVVRLQTSRLLNLKAAHNGKRVIRGDMTSAFLHVDADEPFATLYPEGHPDQFDDNGVEYGMLWGKLVYGKGNAPRGLREDAKLTLEAIGFVEQTAADSCLYVHEERGLDLGLYVDDVEISGDDDQLEWVKAELRRRYLIKFLGSTSVGDPEATEKSKTYVGIRTEVNPVTKIVTQDQTALINKAAVRFQFDKTRPRYNPPSHRELRPAEEGANINAKFHSEFRSKVGFVAHVAVSTRFDLAFVAVSAARQLARPTQQAMDYIDEALQFLFSTADQQLRYDCTQPIESTVLLSTDASCGDAPEDKTTGGWVMMWAGAAGSWAVETIRLQVLSSTEAEYCEIANGCKEVIAQRRLFAAFGLKFPDQLPVLVDNQSAIALSCGPATHYQRTKHISIKYHFQRQLLLDGIIRLQHQSTEVQVSDILTKDVGRKVHKRHRDVLCGKVPITFKSVPLPDSYKVYLRRHNEELARRLQREKLAQQFKEAQDSESAANSTAVHTQSTERQVLLAILERLVSSKT